MKQIKFTRENHVIKEFGSDNTVVSHVKHDSINLAKKESHIIQMGVDGALGRGSLKVVK